MRKPKVGVIFDEEMLLHKLSTDHHPERPERAMAIYLNLIKKGIYKELVQLPFEPAEDKHLEYVHPMSHIQKVKDTIYAVGNNAAPKELLKGHTNTRRFQNDTYENRHTATSAFLAAGGTLEGVRAVMTGDVDTAFCIVRPPGHHANCSNVAGFCFFNNVAVAARYAQRELGVKRVCIFDWDVHVGDGTSRIFYEDDSVMYMSIHRFDNGAFYPGPDGKHSRVGEGKGRGYNV
jgi:acetoin utilization deacetylase AcuC-like enzyme